LRRIEAQYEAAKADDDLEKAMELRGEVKRLRELASKSGRASPSLAPHSPSLAELQQRAASTPHVTAVTSAL